MTVKGTHSQDLCLSAKGRKEVKEKMPEELVERVKNIL